MTNTNSIWHTKDEIPEDYKVFCYVNFSGDGSADSIFCKFRQ